MAEQKSLTKTNLASKALTSMPLPAKMSLFIDEITLAEAAIADIGVMLDLPAGFIPVGGQVVAAALGSGVTIAVGKRVNGTDDDDAFLAATAMNTAGKTSALAFGALAQAPLAANNTVILTVGGAEASGKVTLMVWGYSTMS